MKQAKYKECPLHFFPISNKIHSLQLCRKQRGANSTMLLVNICLCMTTYYLLFIFGINNPVQSSKASVSEKNIIPSSDLQQKVDQGPCTAITALLQYFLLATFAWNIMYAAHVFFLIRNALSGPPRSFRTIAMTAGWGTFNIKH